MRCMRLSDQSSLYIGTNQGYVYHVQLSQKHEPGWTTLVDNLGAPVVCMDVLVQSKSKKNEDLRDEDYHQSGDMVVVGDGKGNVTVVLVKTGGHTHCGWRYTWAAEKERQLLGVFWCKSLEGRSALHVPSLDLLLSTAVFKLILLLFYEWGHILVLRRPSR